MDGRFQPIHHPWELMAKSKTAIHILSPGPRIVFYLSLASKVFIQDYIRHNDTKDSPVEYYPPAREALAADCDQQRSCSIHFLLWL